MTCSCEACLEDAGSPPADWIDWALEQAAEACWRDMADFQ